MTVKPPYDAEVEYLYGKRGPWIDLGFKPTNAHGFRVEMINEGTADNDRVIGCYSSSSVRWAFVCEGASKFYYGWGVATTVNTSSPVRGVRIVAEVNYLNSRSVVVGGTTYGTNLATIADGDVNCALFGNLLSSGIAPSYIMTGRIFGCKISRGSDIVMDLIPVRVGHVGYMYDRVSGQLFGNSGTGEFILGPDVRLVNQPTFLLGAKTEVKEWTNPYVTDGLVGILDAENSGPGIVRNYMTQEEFATTASWTKYGWSLTPGNVISGEMPRAVSSMSVVGQIEICLTEPYGTGWDTASRIFGINWDCYRSGTRLYVRLGQMAVDDSSWGTTGDLRTTWSVAIDTSSSSGAALYRDGVLKRKVGGGGASFSSAINIAVPRNKTIHCIRLYNRQLSEAEIAANYAIDQRRFSL